MFFLMTNNNAQEEEVKKQKEDSTEAKTIIAQFDKVIAGTDGAIFSFIDQYGEGYNFLSLGSETEGLEFADGAPPNRHHPKYDGRWFRVTYDKRMKEYYDGYSGETKKREAMVVLKVRN